MGVGGRALVLETVTASRACGRTALRDSEAALLRGVPVCVFRRSLFGQPVHCLAAILDQVGSIILLQVHSAVEACDLVAVAVEHLGGDVVGEGGAVDAALAGLGPAGVVDGGIDVGVEAVLARSLIIPGGVGLLVDELDVDDGLGVFEAVLPGHDDADGGAVLVGEDVAVAAKGEEGERVHGLVHAQAFGVGPVVAAGSFGHLLAVVEGEELDEFG